MTILVMASFVIAGAFGYKQLPVAAMPRVEFPTIQVTAQLPGASPETMAASVASILERQFSTIAGVTTMTSTSSLGNTSIVLQFDLNRSIDGAALDVQSAISSAMRRLPPELHDAAQLPQGQPGGLRRDVPGAEVRARSGCPTSTPSPTARSCRASRRCLASRRC